MHTYEVTGHLQLLLNRIKDIELGQRGYIITGNEEYLASYHDALKNSLGEDAKSNRLEQHHSVAEEFTILKTLTQDNPAQQQNLDEMNNNLKELLDYWAASIQARHKENGSTASAFDFHHGDQLMDYVRSLFSIMMAEENKLLSSRIEVDKANTRKNNILTFSGIALFYVLMVIAIWLYQRSRREASVIQKQYTQALERSNKELDDFAYVASHDLKAPLRVIDNASKWLEEDLQEHLTDETRDNMRLLRGRVRRMEKLLDDLLEYSRIGRSVDERYAEIINGTALMDNILELLSPPEGFMVKVSPSFADIHVRRMPLQQILMNLISNAIKHHDKKKGCIEVTVKDSGAAYAFAVKDDGPGIPAQFHEQIFKMFQTLKPRDQVEGSGMGLAMVRKNIEVFSGKLTLESSEGKGSIFRFTWPKQQSTKGGA